MFYAYILQSTKNGKRYCGSTDNLRRRINEHNSGIGGTYTKNNGPYKLLFYEAYLDYKDAKNAEKFYKTGYGREVLNGKLQNYLKNAQ